MLLRLTSSTLAVMAMTAPVAFSLTADEVWQTWETYLTSHGYEVSVGARDDSGDALTLREVVLSMADPASSMVSAITIPLINMSPTGGADIRSEFPMPITFKVEGRDDDDEKVLIEGSLDATGAETISREDGDRQADTVTMSEGVLAISRIEVDDESLGPDPMTLVMHDLHSATIFGGDTGFDTESSLGRAVLVIDMKEADGSATIKGEGEFGAMEFASQTSFPTGHDSRSPAAMAEALRAGATAEGKGTIASMKFDLDVKDNPDGSGNREEGTAQTQFGPTSFEFGLADGRLGYQFDVTDMAMSMQGSGVPAPVDISIDTISFDIQFPLLADEDAQPFKLTYSLGALNMNEEVWGMMDPQGVLPHDPANFDLDLNGDLILRQDLLTLTDASEADLEDSPILPVNLTLSQLALSAVGASANAQGSLRFPEPGNFEVMAGDLTARFQGMNALLDKLVNSGLLGEDEVGGARMMLMMFAKPVDGEVDTLETKLEVNEAGNIFANGVQIQ